MSISAACIDITGSSRAMDVAYLEDDALHLRTESNLKSFLDWVTEQKPNIVAVDAPSKENSVEQNTAFPRTATTIFELRKCS
jgi:hypothetical protein